MINRIGFTLISAAIAITVVAFARSKIPVENATVGIPSGPYDTSRRSTALSSKHDLLDRNSVLISAPDPLAIQAGEAVRIAFNAQRTEECKSMDLYHAQGAIQYAKKAEESNGTVHYTLEIVFDGDAVLARVDMLPDSRGATFQLIFSIPAPCESGLREQLAVSALGTRPCIPQ
jgi:hypothetical protein